MYSPQFYGLSDEPTTTPPVAALPTVQPVVPQRYWKGREKPFAFPRRGMQPKQPQQPQPGGLQFYDHQMALAAQQNAQQQVAQAPTAEPSGIGGISWPVIALAGGGFLMLMMVMMSGKK